MLLAFDSVSLQDRHGRRRAMLGRSATGIAVVVVALGLSIGHVGATWSVVGADAETGEVGVAIASCVPGEALGALDAPLAPVVLVPGTGAAVTQGALNEGAGIELERAIAFGATAVEAIAAVSTLDFDPAFEERQHAVVLLDGDSSAFTGAATLDATGHATAPFASAQGNLLADRQVVEDALSAFERGEGSLADRLVAALVAGSEAGGDVRCPGQTALFAQVAVAGPTDEADAPSTLLTVTVDRGDDTNPVARLAERHAAGESVAVVDPEPGRPIRYRIVAAVGAGILVVGIVLRRRRRAAWRAAQETDRPSEPKDLS